MSASFGLFDDAEFEVTLKNEFLSEARELLEEVEPSFLKYEKDPKSEQEMAQIFRLVHTFKGSAAVAGFPGLAAFAHNFETLLSRLRSHEMDPDESIIEILLLGNDALKGYVAVLEKDHAATFDTSAVDTMLLKALNPSQTPVAAKPAAPIEAAPAPRSGGRAPKEGKNQRILVVDDEPTLRECIVMILEDEGYDVVEAQNGLKALEMVLKDPTIKLMLTDQSMPIMKGEELVEKLRAAQIKIPVIVVTGVADHSAAVKFIRSGVYLYLTKPIDAPDLILAVRNALRAGELAETLTKALAFSFRNYLRLRRIDAELAKPNPNLKLDFDIANDLKMMGELISKVLKKA